MPDRTSSQLFSADELWLLQSVIRHEIPQQETWRHPPASLDLNGKIAEALLFLADAKSISEVALVLNLGDCLAIDYCAPQSAKSAAGVPLGKQILIKSYRARREIEDSFAPTADVNDARPADFDQRLADFDASYKPPRPAKSRRRGPREV